MRAIPMCFSIAQIPKYGIRSLANFCNTGFDKLGESYENRSTYRLLCSKTYGVEGGYSKRWTRRPISTDTNGQNKTTQSSESIPVEAWTREQFILRKKVISESVQCCDIQESISQNKDLPGLVTVIVFDIETTGLSRENERIIEIALQDLSGGENSTFHTLVNPGRSVPNPHVHGISTNMVCRPEVPRMVDLIPILLQYVQSRQKPGGHVMFVAHNARTFDVPFLVKEFTRHSYEVPPAWLFVDTLALAREVMKSGGSKLPSGLSLQALREHYGIPLVGSAHRAMSDVNTLSLILQRLTFDLKLSIYGLVERTFTASCMTNLKKKKKKSR
ncbi:hypothetical protein ACOSP7_008859 [Xanthoceras sorbifolium]|uniref:Exonuclease domain-containing protein n=1 Tax=Xanthoceras sorbifolium TaxID=99658 RepID=A0ABQ8ID79_9ROSI|nr:hypothetical protein JRO89_XS03G0326500 [Xanthoceras sorbifolium]